MTMPTPPGPPIPIRHPDGSTTTITVGWDPAPLVPPMLVGNAAGAAPGKGPDYTKYADATTCTLFNAKGAGLNVAAIKAVPAGMHPIVCIKDTYDLVAANLATAAALGREFSVVHHHEPEADMTAAQFQVESAPYAKVCAGWPNVSFGIKLLRYSLLNQDFRPWIPEGIDWAGLDAYTQDGGPYVAADDLISIAVDMAEFANVPGALTEFMTLRATTDTTGGGRAALIGKVIAACRRAQFRFAQFWDGLGSKNKTYPLGIPFGPFAVTSPEYGAARAVVTGA